MAPTVPASARVMTTEHEESLARQVLGNLAGPEGKLAVEHGEHRAELPPQLGRILQQVLEAMAIGSTVTVVSTPSELTTSNAAAILGISRPTLVKLIADGRIPAHKVGTHHRLVTEDVYFELRARRSRERAAFLALRDELDDED